MRQALVVDDGAAPEEQEVVLPRGQQGSAPQHLLLTLLGDYWYERTEHLPSAALVEVLAEFGISSAGTRAALSRLSRRGLLVSSKHARSTYYGLSERALGVLREGTRHILAFGSGDQPWNETWTLVAFSVPEPERDRRHRLRTRLRWLGLAPLYDGFWVSPRARPEDVLAALDELGVGMATVVTGTVTERPAGLGDPILAWDLEGLRKAYEDFVSRFASLQRRTRAGTVGAAEGLRARTEIMDAWRNMPNLDPELPSELLPPRWPRADARQLFVEVYDGLGPLAEMRIRQILSGYSESLAELATHHTSAGR